MKKAYIRPAATAVEFHAESAMLTASVSIKIDKNDETNSAFSTGRGWSSSDWSNEE